MMRPNSETFEVMDNFVILLHGQEYGASPPVPRPLGNTFTMEAPPSSEMMRNGVETEDHHTKRKLSCEQLQRLLESFEDDERLSYKKKMDLATELELAPSRVASWYRSQRARCKAKKAEEEFDTLQNRYDGLRSNFYGLLRDYETMRIRADALNERVRMQERMINENSRGLKVSVHNIEANMSQEEDDSAQGEVVDPEITTLEYSGSSQGLETIVEDEPDAYSFPELASMMDNAMMIHY